MKVFSIKIILSTILYFIFFNSISYASQPIVGFYPEEKASNPINIKVLYQTNNNVINLYTNNLNTDQTLNVLVPGTGTETIIFNAYNLLIDAADSWHQAGLRLNLMTGDLPDDHDGTVRGISIRYDYSYDDSPADTALREMPKGKARIKIKLKWFQNRVYEVYKKEKENGTISKSLSLKDFINILLKESFVHELGHALGLTHPSSSELEESPYWARTIIPRYATSPEPSIMIGGSITYLRQLGVYLQRDISVEDIRPSPSDITGTRIMFEGGAFRVYLLSTDWPRQVFRSGITRVGRVRDSLRDFASNMNCIVSSNISSNNSSNNTAFIGLSLNEKMMIDIATKYALLYPKNNVYLYKVMGNTNIYSLATSLRSLSDKHKEIPIAPYIYTNLNESEEYIAYKNIPGKNIESAKKFYSSDGIHINIGLEDKNLTFENKPYQHASYKPYVSPTSSQYTYRWLRYMNLSQNCLMAENDLIYD